MPDKMMQKCQRYSRLKSTCPAMVPEVHDPTFQRALSSHNDPGSWVFFAEWNAPHPGLTDRNAPPAFAHLNLFVGPMSERPGSQHLGSRMWNGREGELVLAPPYPIGGMEGDHLIFKWAEGGLDHSLSLHAWEPLVDTEATLRAIVESLPQH
jgi:hypothetical protein